jgi:alpha-tubulin suppressor-like RCC1 family protein
MLPFSTLPLEAIQSVAHYHQLALPSDLQGKYQMVWDFVSNNQELYYPSVLVADYLWAYQKRNAIKTKYSTSSIVLGSPESLEELVVALDLPELDRARILRILTYLELLDDDFSAFDKLPDEIIYFIASKVECQSLGLLCELSQKFKKVLCDSGKLTVLLRNKLEETMRISLTNYNQEQLELLCLVGSNNLNNKISAGYTHSLVIDSHRKSGQVYVFGSDLFELSYPRGNSSVGQPFPIPGIDDVVAVSAGDRFSLLLTKNRQVYSFGRNNTGQLGLGANGPETDEPPFGESTIDVGAPTLIENLKEIVAISAGGYHSLFLNNQGQVFSCGDNETGQLGIGNNEDAASFAEYYDTEIDPWRYEPTLIEELEGIVAISAGHSHSLLLNSQGQVLSCGHNVDGQLGLGDDEDHYTPTLIEESKDIVAISAGHSHSLILDGKGRVFSFGNNYHGELGLGDEELENQETPVLIEFLEDEFIISISAGGSHSLVLTSRGLVFAFGSNLDGRLGIGDIAPDNYYDPVLLDISDIVAIAAGGSHSLLLDRGGQIFSFGNYISKQLGRVVDDYQPAESSGLITL